jgi:hypothetical protein
VKQNEVASMMKEIEWRKMSDEIKDLNSWRQKAESLENVVKAQKLEIETLSNQSKLNFSKYQSLVMANAFKEKNQQQLNNTNRMVPRETNTTNEVSTVIGDEEARGNTGSGSVRPMSAPTGTKQSYLSNQSSDEQRTATRTTSSFAITQRKKNNSLLVGQTLAEVQAKELITLKALIIRKDESIRKLSQKLSTARSFPLLNVLSDDINHHHHHHHGHHHNNNATDNKPYGQTNKNISNNGRTNLGGFYLNEDDDDSEVLDDGLESVSSAFLAEENELTRKRFDFATKVQKEYKDKILRTKAKNSPHIKAIRDSKSFSKDK